MTDTFAGDDRKLAANIRALLAIQNPTPPIPGAARQLLESAAARLDPQEHRRGEGWLSDNFTLAELTASATAARKGLDNTPPPEVLDQLILTADRMEGVRQLLGNKPIRVLSGYRSDKVNRAVGGSRTSAHRTGHAVDFVCPAFGTPAQVAAHLAKHLTNFDQLIEEFGGWVHVGFGPGQRGQLLTARKVGGRTRYTQGIKG